MVNTLEKTRSLGWSRSKKGHFRAPERTMVHEERRIMILMKRLAKLVNGYEGLEVASSDLTRLRVSTKLSEEFGVLRWGLLYQSPAGSVGFDLIATAVTPEEMSSALQNYYDHIRR